MQVVHILVLDASKNSPNPSLQHGVALLLYLNHKLRDNRYGCKR